MRFLADENLPARAVEAHRQTGAWVDSVLEIARGAADEPVMKRALVAGAALAHIVKSRTDREGHFSVVEPGRVRMRALASS